MPTRGRGPDDPDDAAALAAYASALADGIEQALPGWVERSVERLLMAYRGSVLPGEREAAARPAWPRATPSARRCARLLLTDIDDQAREPVGGGAHARCGSPTDVLREAGVPPVVRDEFAERQFPDDVYDLSPASSPTSTPPCTTPGSRGGRPRPTCTWPAAAGRES